MEGGCACGSVRYRLVRPPMFVHCCHCRDCQRESGSAFIINALIERSAILVDLAPVEILTPSASGKGQRVHRCGQCQVALWSHYPGAGPAIAFVRAGTLDEPQAVSPDVHIYTRSKLPWVVLPEDVPAFSAYYEMEGQWPAESWPRFKGAIADPGTGSGGP